MKEKYQNIGLIKLNKSLSVFRILFTWESSIWQKLWLDIFVFIGLYAFLSLLYRFVFVNDITMKQHFEGLVIYIQKIAALVPLSFLLGFFVSTVLGRWWSFVNSMPWMPTYAFRIQAFFISHKQQEMELVYRMRRNILRYMNLAWILQMVKNSYLIRNRFKPKEEGELECCGLRNTKGQRINYKEMFKEINEDSYVQNTFGKLITDDEIDVFIERAEQKESYEPEFWLPLSWCTNVIREASDLAFMDTDRFYSTLVTMINEFRVSLSQIAITNQFNIPLVYTQIIVIVIYCFYLSQLFSDQFIQPSTTETNRLNAAESVVYFFDAYVPLITILRFMMYMGWFRVGLSLLNPLREDQSQFPTNMVLNYNLKISLELGLLKDNYLPRCLVTREKMEQGLDENEKLLKDVFTMMKKEILNSRLEF